MNASKRVLLAVAIMACVKQTIPQCQACEDSIPMRIQNQADLPLQTVPLVAAAGQLNPGGYQLGRPGSSSVSALVYEEEGTRFLATILRDLPAGGSKWAITANGGPTESRPLVEVSQAKHSLAISINGRLFTKYEADLGPKPYFFPLIGPTGDRYTRAYPMEKTHGEDQDHPHQRSFWFTHGKVNGVDFWSETPGHGYITPSETKLIVAGPAYVKFTTKNVWYGPDRLTRICEDERKTRIFFDHDCRIIDVDIIVSAPEGPATFGDTKEGSFGLRVASNMDAARKSGGRIVNAEGLENEAAWGKPSPWVDYSGPVEGKEADGERLGRRTVGIAILNHPSSFRHPTTWHVRPYGLFAANPFGWHDFGSERSGEYTIQKGQSITLKHRVILHRGTCEQANIAAAYQAYAKPPKLLWETTKTSE